MRWMPALVLLTACGGDPALQPDAATDATPTVDAPIDANPNNPMTLLETGLCSDAGCAQIAPGIQEYRPRWELYADGATKRRWIYLPPGTKIDTSDMDFWKFPVGTKLWKEFTRDGTRVETRLVMRTGPGESNQDWFYMAYVWNQAQDATTAEAFGVPDANGTAHDVPNRSQCKTCHDNLAPSRVLGFSALQLDFSAGPGQLDLAALVAGDLLTNDPPAPQGGASYPLPSDASTLDKTALGYLHGNCGHCHNPTSKVYIDNGVVMQLRLTVGTLNLYASTTTYSTTVNKDGTTSGIDNVKKILTVGNPNQSQIMRRFESMDSTNRMPDLGVETPDPAAAVMLRDWITNVPL